MDLLVLIMQLQMEFLVFIILKLHHGYILSYTCTCKIDGFSVLHMQLPNGGF